MLKSFAQHVAHTLCKTAPKFLLLYLRHFIKRAMLVFIKIILWASIFGLVHTYAIFPILLRLLKSGRKKNNTLFSANEMPSVAVIIPAYNEEKVMAQKLQSIVDGTFPLDKIKIIVASDNSTDGTDAIVKEFSKKFSFVSLKRFENRSGKIVMVNKIAMEVTEEILVITDANVLFDHNTLFNLVNHFKNPEIGLVDSNMINSGMRKAGISQQEKTYIQTEVGTKEAESIIWGSMMGPFGGCYAVRKNLYVPVPQNFLVDDFYINMKVLEQNFKCINETNALVFEDVSNNLHEEFRRKVRIATGNFQNLFSFKHLLLKGRGIGFCFLSHKVLRWIGPVLLLLIFFSSLLLIIFNTNDYNTQLIYQIIFYSLCAEIAFVGIDRLLNKTGIHLLLLRFNTHFFYMNVALFVGMIKYFSGVKSSIWEPTQRHQ